MKEHKYNNPTQVKQANAKIIELPESKPQDLIGRKVRGFRFENEKGNVYWNIGMRAYIGKVGQIIEKIGGFVTVQFDDATWGYPISLIHEHLVEYTTSPQIIDLSNVEGVDMLVSCGALNWSTRNVVAKVNGRYIDSDGDSWNFAKPIEVKKVTMKEVEELFGCKVEIVKEVSND